MSQGDTLLFWRVCSLEKYNTRRLAVAAAKNLKHHMHYMLKARVYIRKYSTHDCVGDSTKFKVCALVVESPYKSNEMGSGKTSGWWKYRWHSLKCADVYSRKLKKSAPGEVWKRLDTITCKGLHEHLQLDNWYKALCSDQVGDGNKHD
jgi:hypothetical protein